MAATSPSLESADGAASLESSPGATTSRAATVRAAAAAAALLVLTNGPVLLFSKRVLDRTGRWEDHAVWPMLAAAAACGAVLAARELLVSPRPLRDRVSLTATAAVGCFTLAAVLSFLWSVDPWSSAWRSWIYVGMALLAFALASFKDSETALVLAAVTGAAVAASLLLVWLRPDLALHPDGDWKGVYTNRNSLGPLAAIGVLVSIRYLLSPGRWPRGRASRRRESTHTGEAVGCVAGVWAARERSEQERETPRRNATVSHLPAHVQRVAATSLAAGSIAVMVGAGSRTAWISLAAATAAATLVGSDRWLRRRWSASAARTATLSATGLAAAAAVVAASALWSVPTFSQRREMWGLVWDRIVQRPLLGHGFFTFWDIDELTQHVLLRRGSAHNSLVEVGLGLGLLGVVPFAVIVFLAARNSGLALWRRPGPDTWMGGALVAFLIVENLTESFVLWFSYSWVLLMAAALRPAPSAADPSTMPEAGASRAGARAGAFERLHRARRAVSGRLAMPPPEAPPQPAPAGRRQGLSRLRSGWVAVALMSLTVVAVWLPDLDLPLGNSDDGRLVAFSGLHARNFWELGPLDSSWGARVDPFVRPEFDVAARSVPPVEAVTYAHHPPLKDWMSTVSVGLFGQNLPALRIPAFLMGAATLAFMASLLRACRLRWGPVLLAVGAMACSGFFYVYARLGVGFSLLVASAAAVAWLRQNPKPSRWALLGTGVLAALTAMQSWIAMAVLAPLTVWLLAGRVDNPTVAGAAPYEAAAPPELVRLGWRGWLVRRWSDSATALVAGTAAGVAITAAWMLNATGLAELVDQVSVRVSNEVTSGSRPTNFTFGEFLSRQWSFATEELMVPGWLRALLVPALLAGLIDRRTRTPTAITLAAAAAMTFGLQQGAWIHRLWNFPWLAPVTIGLASLFDAARRLAPARWRVPAALAAGAVIGATLLAVATGGTRDRYIGEPALLGDALEQVADTPEAGRAEVAWTGPGLPAPRWASYYLDVPVWDLEERRLPELAETDLVILRASRKPDFLPADALEDPLAEAGDFLVITAASLSR